MQHWFGSDEHRRQYEQFVDDALHLEETLSGLAAVPNLNVEQLRTATLDATPSIADAARDEYDRYERTEQRFESGIRQDFGASMIEAGESFGWFALATAMAVIVAGISAVVFLIVGYVLLPLTVEDSSMQHTMQLASLAAVGISLGAAAIGGLAMLAVAARNRARPTGEVEVYLAREEWRRAILHRGILPFMRSRLREASDEGTTLLG
ncbi:hypothetical protein [Embleya scabrispora]|uniref:hypothetical protein n=1 Tax=Embleya scabrispora TaxID=159449 RepID=UPI0003721117|nr:hypothetical protein [Embleya scabrispora]MYS79860.1 hypothetical protein [Streptomyces sp. SID5474]